MAADCFPARSCPILMVTSWLPRISACACVSIELLATFPLAWLWISLYPAHMCSESCTLVEPAMYTSVVTGLHDGSGCADTRVPRDGRKRFTCATTWLPIDASKLGDIGHRRLTDDDELSPGCASASSATIPPVFRLYISFFLPRSESLPPTQDVLV